MESPQDNSAYRDEHNPRLSRRSLLRWSAAGAFAAAGLLTACSPEEHAVRMGTYHPPPIHGEDASPHGPVLLHEVFAGHSLNRERWNPYICDNNSNGWPWFTNPAIEAASSAISGAKGPDATFNLPSAVGVDNGLTLGTYRGSRAPGYLWTGSVICSRPTSNNFGQGTVHTTGFTFADARVEIRAKMPDMTSGQWPSIWFLAAPGSHGAEIDLFEGGLISETAVPNNLMAVNLLGNGHHLLDCGTDLAAGYHTYAMEYRQAKSVKFFFDDSNIYTYTSNIPVGRYFIVLSNAMVSASTVGWHSQVSDITPAINLMHVSDIRVIALLGCAPGTTALR